MKRRMNTNRTSYKRFTSFQAWRTPGDRGNQTVIQNRLFTKFKRYLKHLINISPPNSTQGYYFDFMISLSELQIFQDISKMEMMYVYLLRKLVVFLTESPTQDSRKPDICSPVGNIKVEPLVYKIPIEHWIQQL